jgi:hypothetical protein
VNANGLFVTGLVLKADADEIARFEHLSGRLHKAAFIAVQRLKRHKAW